MTESQHLRIAGFTVDTGSGEISGGPADADESRPEGVTHLEPRVLAVLLALHERAGEVVSRRELHETVWTDTVVTDESLTRCISELRLAFGDDARNPRVIQTVPRRGYRLLAEAAQPSAAPTPSNWYWAVGAVAATLLIVTALGIWFDAPISEEPRPLDSIAVLPFTSPDPQAAHLGHGLAEELMNALTQVPSIGVASRSAAFAVTEPFDLQELGNRLGVDVILEGSVRREGERMRIHARLSDTQTGYQLWSGAFDRASTQVFDVQDEIASAVVNVLRPEHVETVSVSRPTTDIQAWDLYLLGRHEWHKRTPEALTRATELFAEATRHDSQLAAGWAGLADAWLMQASYGVLDEETAIERARPALERALELNPELAEAHASRGLLFLTEGNAPAAEAAFLRATELDNRYSMGHMWRGNALQKQQRWAEASAAYDQAYELDPWHLVVTSNAVGSDLLLGRYDTAAERINRYERFGGRHEMLESMAVQLSVAQADFGRALDQISNMGPTQAAAAMVYTCRVLCPPDMTASWIEQASDSEDPHEHAYPAIRHAALYQGPDAVLASADQDEPEWIAGVRRTWYAIALARAGSADAEVVLREVLANTGEKMEMPSMRLTLISYLLTRLPEDHPERVEWIARGDQVLFSADTQGFSSVDYRLGRAVFLSTAGRRTDAVAEIAALRDQGVVPPWGWFDDPRIADLATVPEFAEFAANTTDLRAQWADRLSALSALSQPLADNQPPAATLAE